MQLNGWVRLWIVLSAIWLACTAIVFYPGATKALARVKYEIELAGVGRFSIAVSRAQSEAEIDAQIDSVLKTIERDSTRLVGQTFDTPYRDYVNEFLQRQAKHLFAFALLPIAFAFIFGWLVAWVRRGFRRRNAGA